MPIDWNRLLSRKEISLVLGKGFSFRTISRREEELGLTSCRANAGKHRVLYRGWLVCEVLRERGLIK